MPSIRLAWARTTEAVALESLVEHGTRSIAGADVEPDPNDEPEDG
jgi:hypothetical protein